MGQALTGQCCAHDGVLETQVVSVPAANSNGYGKPVFSDIDYLIRHHFLPNGHAGTSTAEGAQLNDAHNVLEDALVFSEGHSRCADSNLITMRSLGQVGRLGKPGEMYIVSSEEWNAPSFLEELNVHAKRYSMQVAPMPAPGIMLNVNALAGGRFRGQQPTMRGDLPAPW
mmetsp:Transcript_25733/g.47023  ORF Transcript_25733/g.47023 Transcript_25733/m.47023 type:complete len:170 (-) Transcript_25733:128-637(-)